MIANGLLLLALTLPADIIDESFQVGPVEAIFSTVAFEDDLIARLNFTAPGILDLANLNFQTTGRDWSWLVQLGGFTESALAQRSEGRHANFAADGLEFFQELHLRADGESGNPWAQGELRLSPAWALDLETFSYREFVGPSLRERFILEVNLLGALAPGLAPVSFTSNVHAPEPASLFSLGLLSILWMKRTSARV